MKDELDDPRREFLVKLLTLGALTSGGMSFSNLAQAMGKIPKVLPPGKSFFDINGQVLVNKKTATLDTFIKPGDTIETGPSSRAIFVIGKDAFHMRADSSLKVDGSAIINTLRLFSGKVLSVFGHRQNQKLSLHTSTATIGVRGTGVYMETDPEKSYVCTCYGLTDISSSVNRNFKTTVLSKHHDAPKYILTDEHKGNLIVPAPMINHTDQELILIESLVGREPPFGIEGDLYQGPRKDY